LESGEITWVIDRTGDAAKGVKSKRRKTKKKKRKKKEINGKINKIWNPSHFIY